MVVDGKQKMKLSAETLSAAEAKALVGLIRVCKKQIFSRREFFSVAEAVTGLGWASGCVSLMALQEKISSIRKDLWCPGPDSNRHFLPEIRF